MRLVGRRRVQRGEQEKARSHRITPRELTCRFLERTVEILLANLIGAKLSLAAGQGEVIAIQLESSDPWMRIGETENRETCFTNPGIKTGASWELSTAGDGLGGCWNQSGSADCMGRDRTKYQQALAGTTRAGAE